MDEVSVFTPIPGAVNVLVPVGSLGAGVQEDNVRYGLASGAHVIASDAGSTDSGAAYLALGTSKYSREAVKRDLRILMAAQTEARIPLVIGSCGQSGCDMGLEWTRDIAIEIARELRLTPRIAVIHSEQDPAIVKAKNAQGRIHPLPPHGPLKDATIDECAHIVAGMGPEPYIAALEEGADIILGGRTTDPAVLAAMPLARGVSAASAWHAGKIGECGAQCTVNPAKGKGVLLRISDDCFDVEPLAAENHCSPHSVSAHLLYENSDPFRLTEPGGVLDVSAARYEQVDDRTVRVKGARWEPRPYTMKLEGAALGPFQTIMLVGIEDPDVLSQLDVFHDRLHAALCQRVGQTLGDEAGDYHISLRLYGWNAVSGQPVPPGTRPPREVGVLCVITAATQSLATRIAKACNPYFFHFPIQHGIELPSYGFPFSPAEIERGRVYEFKLNHVIETDDPFEFVRTEWVDLKGRTHG
jgi:Acyclic terpene utilisation family protein AtuA